MEQVPVLKQLLIASGTARGVGMLGNKLDLWASEGVARGCADPAKDNNHYIEKVQKPVCLRCKWLPSGCSSPRQCMLYITNLFVAFAQQILLFSDQQSLQFVSGCPVGPWLLCGLCVLGGVCRTLTWGVPVPALMRRRELNKNCVWVQLRRTSVREATWAWCKHSFILSISVEPEAKFLKKRK